MSESNVKTIPNVMIMKAIVHQMIQESFIPQVISICICSLFYIWP